MIDKMEKIDQTPRTHAFLAENITGFGMAIFARQLERELIAIKETLYKLETENAELRGSCQSFAMQSTPTVGEARLAADRSDAKRYRWLRDTATQDQLYKMPDWPDTEWDAVIDMAMEQRGPND